MSFKREEKYKFILFLKFETSLLIWLTILIRNRLSKTFSKFELISLPDTYAKCAYFLPNLVK